MSKIKYILLFLTCLFLTGCINYNLDYNNINCSLDKSSYKTDENIVLSCEGVFADNNFKGYLSIEFYINKIVNGEKIYDDKPIYTIVDCGNLKNTACVDNGFVAYILDNTNFKEVNEKITLNISEVGEYELHVILVSYVNHAPIGQEKDFRLNFVVID